MRYCYECAPSYTVAAKVALSARVEIFIFIMFPRGTYVAAWLWRDRGGAEILMRVSAYACHGAIAVVVAARKKND